MTDLNRHYHELTQNLREISRLYFYEGRLQDAVDVLKSGIETCRPEDMALEDMAELWVDYGTRITYGIFQLGYALDDAVQVLDNAMSLSKALGDERLEATCLTQYGRAHYYHHFDARQFEKAIDYLEQSSRIQRSIEDWRGLSESLLFLGLIQQFSGNRDKAIRLFQEAYDVAGGFALEQSYAVLHIGMLEYQAEQWQSSLAKIKEALRLRESVGFKQGLPFPHITAGDSLAGLRDYESARAHYEQAQTLAKETNNERALMFATLSLGIMYHDLRDFAQARPYLLDARALAEALGHKRGLALADEKLVSLR
ncbi:MAG: tetratricopeptide repeat protein [Chloroflexi bacterium]|nr:tetratricopeptide repeat protein [Chloroflexota bacterium]